MNSTVRRITSLVAFASVAAAAFSGNQVSAADQRAVQALVNDYCASCHSEQKAEGELRLDAFTAKHWDDYDLFDEMVTRIADGEMPPGDADKPLPEKDKVTLLAALNLRLMEMDNAQLAGQYKKLTAQEYNNTLIDLFGAPVEKLRDLPFDSDHDVKKLGEHQVVTSYAVKKYYDVARAYLDRHILVEMPPVREISYNPADHPKEWVHTSRFNGTPLGPIAGAGNTPAFMLRNPVRSHAEEGEYEITFQWHCFFTDPKSKGFDPEKEYPPAKAQNSPTVDCNKYMQILNAVQQRKDGGHYECRIDQPIRIVLDKEMKFLNFRVNNSSFKSQIPDPRYAQIENSDLSKEEKNEAVKKLRLKIKEENKNKPTLRMLITQATIRGPLNKREPEFHQRVFGELRRDDSFDELRARYWKRQATRNCSAVPLSDELLANYIAIARREYDETQNTYAAVKAALNAMLCSPHFVFKYEANQRELDDYMIASRLSYFLHNSTPDEELLQLAAEGKLKDPAVRRAQALRLLGDRDKAERFTRNFTHQWLGLDQFGQFTPNEAYIQAGHYARLKPSIEEEPYAFFNEVLFGNLSAVNFIDSDFVVWDGQLTSLCQSGDARVERPQEGAGGFQRLALIKNEGRVRGGLVTMPAIMSLTTDGENQQPILRGVWIAEKLLGMEIEPPATVPAIEINLENVSKPREILAKHKEDQSCYVCHVKFDYLGLAMENYDVLGRYKEKYVHPVQDEKGRFQLVTKEPIDSLSETPDGEAMPGVEGVKAHLMEHKGTVMRHLVETLFAYALGREARYRDRDQIAALLKRMRENDYRLQDTVLALVESESFARR